MRQTPSALRAWPMVALLALFAFGACEDDESGPTSPATPAIAGAYEVQSVVSAAPSSGGESVSASPAFFNPRSQWIRFEADNTYAILLASEEGLRALEEGVYLASGSQVILSSGNEFLDFGTDIYNVALSGDVLTLTRPDVTITAMRSDSTPTVSEWIVPLTEVDGVTSPVQDYSDLAWDGTSVWIGNARESDQMYAMDPATMTAVDSLDIDNEGWAIEWRDTELWTSDNGYSHIYRVNTGTGGNDFTSTEMDSWIEGIAWDGTSFWCCGYSQIFQYDPVGDDIVSVVELSQGFGLDGAAFHDGHLYLCNDGRVHQCTVSPFTVVNSYALAGHSITGITNDGTDFYVLAYGLEDGVIRFIKVSLP